MMSLSIREAHPAKFMAVKVSWDNHSQYPNLVRVYPHKPKNMYWGLGGITHCEWNPDRVTIVKDYGVFSDHDDESIDEIERSYYKEFPPIPAPTLELSEGWISPEGVFYNCAYGEHTYLALHLTRSLYESDKGERLIEKTWVRVYENMAMLGLDGKPTDAQLKTLRAIVEANPDKPQIKKGFSDFCFLRDIPHTPTWERGKRCHGYWVGTERVGWVGLSPRPNIRQGRLAYSWECGDEKGIEFYLRTAKKKVERAYSRMPKITS